MPTTGAERKTMDRVEKFSIDEFDIPEGATPILDYSDLIPTWVHTRKDLNRVEAENIMAAQHEFLRNSIDDPKNWFNVKDLKTIHQTMFGKVWKWAGAYRKGVTSIGVKPSMVPSQLADFCAEVRAWSQYPVELTFLEMAVRVHHRLVSIHPFENGNGRFSRFASDRFLLAWRRPHPIWPSYLNHDSMERNNYIQTLKKADDGDYEPLIEFTKRHGASDPNLCELLNDKSYRKCMDRKRLYATIKASLRRGCDPNVVTSKGYRALHLAAKAGGEEIVGLLLDAGADIHAQDHDNLTAFQVAVLQENKAMADLLAARGAKKLIPPGLGYAAYYKLYPNQLLF
jgi:Fic-DOC domain mobile mystery protein B